jgi:hypothetical protein
MQRLDRHAFSAGSGQDQGKDHDRPDFPSGPWVSSRGHLENFSDNMFMEATNAFWRKRKRQNLLTGEKIVAFSTIARYYMAQGIGRSAQLTPQMR